MNKIRTNIAICLRKDQWISQLGFSIVYVVVLWYLIIFTWKFLKRVIYMAFLTIIAPLLGITYAIDKLNGGSSQSFNLWFKEYTFNLLIQPIDLLLYTIIVSTAISLVEVNFIYAIVAIGFLLQAEKFIKKMFGLGAEGGAGKGGFASGAVFGSLMSSMQTGSQALSGAMSSGDENSEKNKPVKVRQADSDAPKDLDSFKDGPATPPTGAIPSSGGLTQGKFKIPFLGGIVGSEQEKRQRRYKKAQKKADKLAKAGNGNTPGATQIFMQDEQKRTKRKIRRARVKEGVKGVAKRFVNKKNGMKVAKLATMGVGAATLGMVGLSAGLAANGNDDVLKLGLAGVAGGAMIGKEITKQGKALIEGGKDVIETAQRGYYGEEYNDKKLNPKLDKEWYNSAETKERFRTKYGDKWKEKREEALQLRKQGITDQKDIEKAIKLKDKNPGLTIQQAGSAVNFANNVTSRKELLSEGGEDKVYQQMLEMLGGDKAAADKAMKTVKQALKISEPKNKKGS